MTPVVLAGVIALAFLLGSGLQRISGLGTGLVVAPVLTLVLGPAVGVSLSNAGAIVTAIFVLTSLRSDIDWKAFARLAPLLVVGSVSGAFVVLRMSSAWLEVLIGTLILLALVSTLVVKGRVHLRGRLPAVVAGIVGGFMNATAGVAGPAMTIYAVATRWNQASFAATLQPVFLLTNATALVAKASLGAVPSDTGLAWWMWGVAVAAIAGGVLIGGYISRWVPTVAARRTAITIATLGGIVTLVRGLLSV